jgi:hypothetical protein
LYQPFEGIISSRYWIEAFRTLRIRAAQAVERIPGNIRAISKAMGRVPQAVSTKENAAMVFAR